LKADTDIINYSKLTDEEFLQHEPCTKLKYYICKVVRIVQYMPFSTIKKSGRINFTATLLDLENLRFYGASEMV
jgi:hypothetical protein